MMSRLGRATLTVIRDPVEGVERIREKLANERQRFTTPPAVAPEPEWEAWLHRQLGVEWPCDAVAEFERLWPVVVASVADKGITVGRGSFSGWDDGDAALARAAWCVARHTQPQIAVETGVARGFTTRVILEALEADGAGRLYSIDLPPPLEERRLAEETGVAVADQVRGRWTLIRGSSRRRLPGLLRDLGTIDMFVHDSRHTYRNISFELGLAWPALRPGGFLLADDVGANGGFLDSVQEFGDPPAVVCMSDDQRGKFGLIHKAGASGGLEGTLS
jgi:Methyltransferase domain